MCKKAVVGGVFLGDIDDIADQPASDHAEPRTKNNANHFTFDAGYDILDTFEARVFGTGHYAQMMPICRPPDTH